MELSKEYYQYYAQVVPRYLKDLDKHFGSSVRDEPEFKEISTSNEGLSQMNVGDDVLKTVRTLVRLAVRETKPTNLSWMEQETSTQKDRTIVGPSSDPIYSSVELNKPEFQIRLIELLPGQPHDTIVVKLFVADTVDTHPYEAMSYVWGSRDSDVTITVNSKQFDVSANLADALRCLRPAVEKDSRILWVDAICINQTNNAEKSAQVAMMGDIYRGASNVLIFLGEEKDDSALVMQYLGSEESDIAESEASANPVDQDLYDRMDQNDKSVIQRIQRCGFNLTQFLCAAEAFFRRPWWSRLWVVQEFALARQQPTWHCGRLSVTTTNLQERLIALFNYYINCATPMISSFPNIISDTQVNFSREPATFLQRRHNIRLLLAFHSSGWEQLLPGPVMIRSMYRESSVPHDRIYALREMLEPVSRAVLFPDYSAPVNELFLNLSCLQLIHDFWKIDVCKYGLMKSSGIPSWALDYAQPTMVSAMPQMSLLTENDSDCSAYNRIMGISGVVLDELDTLCSFDDAKDDLHTLGLSWKMECCLQHCRPTKALPEEANAAVPKHCYVPLLDESLMEIRGAFLPVTNTIPGYADLQLAFLKAALQPGPRFCPENLTCNRWQDGPRRPADRPPLEREILHSMQQATGENLLAGACFDSTNLKAQVRGVKLQKKKDFNLEQISDENSNTNIITPQAVDEYIPQYDYIKNILHQANSEAELDSLKDFVYMIADFCAATVGMHYQNPSLSHSQIGREIEGLYHSSHASMISSWREIISNCSCNGEKKDEHQGILQKLISDAEGVEAALRAQIQVATAALNRKQPNGLKPASQMNMSLRRHISSIFISSRGFAGFTTQKHHSLKRGDILAILDGVSAPTILEKVGDTGRYRMKCVPSVVGIKDMDIGRLVELGLCIRMNFHIV